MPARLGRRKDYNLVDDAQDSHAPVHNEDAFLHGINFKAKYIGTLDVPRPSGRTEIVIAMRRIRYEFKAKSVKKRKVNIRVSTEGVQVVLRKKKKKKKDWAWELDRMLIMQDPIYRIFYVSHDSHDLKIWSYIARDGASNVFRCNVFKSPKKSLAMHIVRTIGQAFDVCHKLNIGPPPKKEKPAKEVDKLTEKGKDADEKKTKEDNDGTKGTNSLPAGLPNGENGLQKSETEIAISKSGESECNSSIKIVRANSSFGARQQALFSQQKVLHDEQQIKVALSEVSLLKDKLAAETTARVEAQNLNQQLLHQNKELLKQLSEMILKLTLIEEKYGDLPDITESPSSRILSGHTFLAGSSLLGLSTLQPTSNTSHFENTTADNTLASPDLEKNPESGLNNDITVISPQSTQWKSKCDMSSSSSSSEDISQNSFLLSNVKNDSAIVNQTKNTSIWTSKLATPELMPRDETSRQHSRADPVDSFFGSPFHELHTSSFQDDFSDLGDNPVMENRSDPRKLKPDTDSKQDDSSDILKLFNSSSPVENGFGDSSLHASPWEGNSLPIESELTLLIP